MIDEIKVGQKYTENNSEYRGGRRMRVSGEPNFQGWSYYFIDTNGGQTGVTFKIRAEQLLSDFTLIK
jgi:hypothetical protein